MKPKKSAAPQVRRDLTDIIHTVAAYYGVSPTEMLEKGRGMHLIQQARAVAYGLARDLTTCSVVEIGMVFDREQSSVSHGVRTLCTRMKRDDQLARSVAVCRARCLEVLAARRMV